MPEITLLCTDQIENNFYIFSFVINIISLFNVTFTLNSKRVYVMDNIFTIVCTVNPESFCSV